MYQKCLFTYSVAVFFGRSRISSIMYSLNFHSLWSFFGWSTKRNFSEGPALSIGPFQKVQREVIYPLCSEKNWNWRILDLVLVRKLTWWWWWGGGVATLAPSVATPLYTNVFYQHSWLVNFKLVEVIIKSNINTNLNLRVKGPP